MANVVLTKTLADAAGLDQKVTVSGRSVGEVLDGLCERFSRLRPHLLAANGNPKGHVLLVLGEERANRATPIGEHDELRILLATAGGSGT
jgi:molybdopterin converting factor small subunit